MRQRILLHFVHLGIGLAVKLENRIPTCTGQSMSVKDGHAGENERYQIY